jgi:hypothetical protein
MIVGSAVAGGSYTVEVKDRKFTVTQQQLAGFRKFHLATSELDTRRSEIIWLDICTWETVYGISAQEVLSTIQDSFVGLATSKRLIRRCTLVSNMQSRPFQHLNQHQCSHPHSPAASIYWPDPKNWLGPGSEATSAAVGV